MVSGSEPRSYWRFVPALIGTIVVAVALVGIWALYPEDPHFAGEDGRKEISAGYYPGGSDCYPHIVNRLSGRERERRADACNDAREQHRLSANDLIEQRRAATAAEESAKLTGRQTELAVIGLALGFVTMAAAIAAAIFARSAAKAAQDALVHAESAVGVGRHSAAAGWEAADIAKQMGMVQVRAHLSISNIKVTEPTFHEEARVYHCRADFTLRNTGNTQTRALRFDAAIALDSPPAHRRYKHATWGQDLAPQDEKKFSTGVIVKDYEKILGKDVFAVYLFIEIWFTDVFGKKISEDIYLRGTFGKNLPWPITMRALDEPFEVIRAQG